MQDNTIIVRTATHPQNDLTRIEKEPLKNLPPLLYRLSYLYIIIVATYHLATANNIAGIAITISHSLVAISLLVTCRIAWHYKDKILAGYFYMSFVVLALLGLGGAS